MATAWRKRWPPPRTWYGGKAVPVRRCQAGAAVSKRGRSSFTMGAPKNSAQCCRSWWYRPVIGALKWIGGWCLFLFGRREASKKDLSAASIYILYLSGCCMVVGLSFDPCDIFQLLLKKRTQQEKDKQLKASPKWVKVEVPASTLTGSHSVGTVPPVTPQSLFQPLDQKQVRWLSFGCRFPQLLHKPQSVGWCQELHMWQRLHLRHQIRMQRQR